MQNPLEDPQRVVTEEEARAALKQFFGSISPTERRRMARNCFSICRTGT